MLVTVRVVPAAGARPPTDAPVVVEVRDVSEADAPSATVARVETTTGLDPDDETTDDVPAACAVVDVEVDDALLTSGRDLSVWARIGASGQPTTAAGDWLTVRSYPLTATTEAVDAEVRPI